MIQILHKYTLAAVHEQQKEITDKCNLQYLKVLKDRACEVQQEYIKARNKVME